MSLTLYRNHPPRDARRISPIVREQRQWEEILADLTAQEAAARIFGDLMCYTASYNSRTKGMRIRESFYDDVDQLARALDAYASLRMAMVDAA